MAVSSGKSIMRSSAAVYLIGAAGVCAGQAPAGMFTPAILTNADRIAMDDDYPASAIRAGQHGSVTFALDIDPLGEPVSCTVVTDSGSDALDHATCMIWLARAHFTPARGSDGNAIGSRYMGRMNWVIP